MLSGCIGFEILLLLWLALIPLNVLGWGKIGHEMVANIAWLQLSPEIQSWVCETLDLGSAEKIKNCTASSFQEGSPLAAVANWADIVRYTHFYHWSTPLHYVDIEDSTIQGHCPVMDPAIGRTNCHFNYTRDCTEDLCVAGAIANYSRRLVESTSNAHRNTARYSDSNTSLKFLTHFLGDIHQPLHSARKSDKGGNSIHVHFSLGISDTVRVGYRNGVHSTKGWNLHSIWDDGIIEKAMKELFHGQREEFEHYLFTLMQGYSASGQIQRWLECADGRNKACTSIWTEESLALALSWAYRDVDGNAILDGGVISDEYIWTRLPLVNQQIVAAGIRLARTLDLVYADTLPRQQFLRRNFRSGTSSAQRNLF